MPSLNAATVFPIPDDGENDVIVSRQYQTNVQPTESGTENRAAWRSAPRRRLSYTALFENAAQAGQFKALWANAAERLRFIVPLWPRYAIPTAFPDASTISGEFADRGFVAGEKTAVLLQSLSAFEAIDIETVADDTLTLATPIAGTYAIGPVRVIPAMAAWLEPPSLEQLAIDSERVALTFIEELPGVAGIDPTKGSAITPVAMTITHEVIFASYAVGFPKKSGAARVTVFDAAGMPIPNAPLTWLVTPPDGAIITFPGDGNVIAADWEGNAFSGVLVTAQSGSASSPTFAIG